MKQKLCIVALALSVLLAGCSGMEVTDQQFGLPNQPAENEPVQEKPVPEPVSTVNLAYSVNDTLNPYTMTTKLNRELVPLLYDSLTRPDKSFQPEYQLATEIIMQEKACTVKFRRNAQFSDGTLLTGEDITYSIQTALTTDTNWRTMLQNIANYTVNTDGDVVIQLYQEDANFPALLTFPIIKKGTAGADYPTGVSKFYVSGTWGNTGVVLTANPIYYGDTGSIETVMLANASDPDALAFNLKSGDIDLVYSDLSSPELANMSASSVPVSLCNLVYLGINGNYGWLARAEFRQAISLAVNRDEIVSKAYVSRARATRYPFNPEFYRMNAMELSTPRSLTQADALLDGIGLSSRDDNRMRLVNGRPLTLRLLVNSENAYRNAAATLVTEQLAQIGIKVEVVSQAFSQYQQTLQNGDYDLYLGETRLMYNMDIAPLLAGGALGYFTAYSEELSDSYRAYRATGAGIESFCELFLAQSPFVPLVFRQGSVSHNREFRAEIVATEQDIFYNIVEW
ncbi:ABC transporter substrate-binding protein [Anaerotruncus rubiinfantis]|uniref:ABC transporter substrate-binding protein n=1 Tax=Anaerotruncus rubiinfantis TaxID=1720200 RepID=UPI001898A8B0|nr:ABC transporter substrate-binding protein [Anaerotruncus rubiinfantis]